jgi:hypothetical protein
MRVDKRAKPSDIEVISIDRDAKLINKDAMSGDKEEMSDYIGAKRFNIEEM